MKSMFQMWEAGIKLCKTLALQYETETFNYIQLSEILVSGKPWKVKSFHQIIVFDIL